MNDQTEHTAAYYEETWRNRPVKFTVAELDARASIRANPGPLSDLHRKMLRPEATEGL